MSLKLNLNPLQAKKDLAEKTINQRFEFGGALKIAAYVIKQSQAEAVLAGGTPTPEFEAASKVEGMSVNEFATLVASKPSIIMQLETQRRQRILAVRAATTLEAIKEVEDATSVSVEVMK